ncbi:hypothetical protein ACJX0J_025018, partial [Zea mays]
ATAQARNLQAGACMGASASELGIIDTTYMEFSETRPLVFVKAEEPLDSEATPEGHLITWVDITFQMGREHNNIGGGEEFGAREEKIWVALVATTPEGEAVLMGMFFYCIPNIESKKGLSIQSLGGQIFTKEVVFHVLVKLAGHDFPTNMIVIKGQDIDVILGMNWLVQNEATRRAFEAIVQEVYDIPIFLIEIRPEDILKTAFTTRYGLF